MKTADKNLQLLENMLRAGTWAYNVPTRELYWSPGLFRLLGLDPNVVVASSDLYDSLVHPEDRLSHDELVERAGSGALTLRRFRMIRPDGHLLWLEGRTDRQYDRQGKLHMLHGVVQDVTEQHKALSEQVRFSSVTSSVKMLTGGDFWRTDAEGRFIDTHSWARFTGESAERLKDHVALPAVHPDDRDLLRQAREQGIRTRRKVEVSVRVRRRDGNYQCVDHKFAPVLGTNGELIEWHGMSWPVEEALSETTSPVALTSGHVRAARMLLGLTARQLAELADVSFSTVRRIEDDAETVKPESVKKVRSALLARGIRFENARDGATGVSLTGK